MADSFTVARPYAKALYEIAIQNDANAWLPVMTVCEQLGEDKDAQALLKSRNLTAERLMKVIEVIGDKTRLAVPKEFVNFIDVLSNNKRFALLPEIASLFISEVKKSNDVIVAEIISAKALSDESKATLVQRLEARYGKKVEASVQVDQSLIGGAVIRVGDKVIDGSLKGRIEQLTKALN